MPASLELLDKECEVLGVSIAAHKCDGPITCLIFLRVEVDKSYLYALWNMQISLDLPDLREQFLLPMLK